MTTPRTGRPIASLSYPAGSANPISIVDTKWFAVNILGVWTHQRQQTQSYTCEQATANGPALLDEVSCRSQTTPVTDRAVLRGLASGNGPNFVAVRFQSVVGSATNAQTFDEASCSSTEFDFNYDADTYKVVPHKSSSYWGSSVQGGFDGLSEIWSCHDGELASASQINYDSTLRFPELTCGARNTADLLSNGILNKQTAVCAAQAYDAQTGQVLSAQKPENWHFDIYGQGGSGFPLTTGVTSYAYDSFRTHITNAWQETSPFFQIGVVSETDLATGVVTKTTGPNVHQGSYVVIDGFGRTLEEWVSIGDSPDPSSDHDYLRTRVVEYDDNTNSMKEWLSRSPSPEEALVENYNNNSWIENHSEYDSLGRLAKQIEWDINAQSVEKETLYDYDERGNLTKVTTADPSSGGAGATTIDHLFSYDSLNRRTCETAPDGSGAATVYSGRRVEVTEFGDDGGDCANPTNPTASSPRAARSVNSDLFGRVTRVEERLDAVSGAFSETEYEYDSNANISLIRRVDPIDGDIVTTMTHDLVGNRISLSRHGKDWSYTYDRNGNMLTETAAHPSGSAAAYTSSTVYDQLDRPTERLPAMALVGQANQPTAAELAVAPTKLFYDQGTNGKSQLTRKEHGNPNNLDFSIDYEYDARGLLFKETRSVDLNSAGIPLADSLVLEHQSWNSLGQPAIVIEPTGEKISTVYTRSPGVPKIVYIHGAHANESEWFMNFRNTAGLVVRMQHFVRRNNTAFYERNIFTSRDQLGRVTRDRTGDADLDQKIDQQFTYYGTSEIATHKSHIGALASTRNFTYSYDDLHQLVSANDDQGYTSSFSFTDTGRLKTAHVTANAGPGTMVSNRNVSYVYPTSGPNADPERLSGLTPNDPNNLPMAASFLYDDAGNMASRTIESETVGLFYDGNNRLRVRTLPDSTNQTYFYDGAERWLAVDKNSAGTATKVRWWFGASQVEFDCTAQTCARSKEQTTVTLGARTVARVEKDVASGAREVKSLHSNGLGHLLGVYSSTFTGSAVEYDLDVAFQYGPFGEILETTENNGANSDEYLRRFNDKELDTATGLSYYGHRYYDSVALTWNRADPLYRFVPDLALGDPRRGNLYTFSANNPIRFVDPDGLDSMPPIDWTDIITPFPECQGTECLHDDIYGDGKRGFSEDECGGGGDCGEEKRNPVKHEGRWDLVTGFLGEKLGDVVTGAVCLGRCAPAYAPDETTNANIADLEGRRTTREEVAGYFSFLIPGVAGAFLRRRGGPFVNLASPSRTRHILQGDATGGGHAFGLLRLFNGKSKFPATWSKARTMNAVSEVAASPSSTWVQQTGRAGAQFTKRGKRVKFRVEGVYDGVKMRVIVQGNDIITAFPIK